MSRMGLRVSVGILSFDFIPVSTLFLSLRDVFLSLGYQGVGEESASIPQSFWLWLTLCSVFSIYLVQRSGKLNLKAFLIWKKVCARMTLLPLVWFLSSGLEAGVCSDIKRIVW